MDRRWATAIAVGVCVSLVVMPSLVHAANPEEVFLRDGDSAVRAQVDDGKLRVGDGSGPLTVDGSVAVSNLPATQQVSGTVNVGNLPDTQAVSGTVNVGNLPANQQVSGTVNALPGGASAEKWLGFTNSQQNEDVLAGPAPVDRLYGISSLTLTNLDPETSFIVLYLTRPSGSGCTTGQGAQLWSEILRVLVPGNSTSHLPFPQALLAGDAPFPTDESFCIIAKQGFQTTPRTAIQAVVFTL